MKTFIALSVAVLVTAIGASLAVADTTDPLLGNWANDPITLTITNTGGVYNVTFTKTQKFGNCTVAPGTVWYTLTPQGGDVYQQKLVYESTSCSGNADYPPSTIHVDVVGQSLFIRCESDPTKTCDSYTRVGGKDTVRPWVKALPASGRANTVKVTRLFHYATDDSGKVSMTLWIYKGSKLIDGGRAPLGTVSTDPKVMLKEYFIYFPKASMHRGTYRWCLQARDAAGNKSAKSCAALVLR